MWFLDLVGATSCPLLSFTCRWTVRLRVLPVWACRGRSASEPERWRLLVGDRAGSTFRLVRNSAQLCLCKSSWSSFYKAWSLHSYNATNCNWAGFSPLSFSCPSEPDDTECKHAIRIRLPTENSKMHQFQICRVRTEYLPEVQKSRTIIAKLLFGHFVLNLKGHHRIAC